MRLRRLFFAAALALVAGCMMHLTPEPAAASAARASPDSQPAASTDWQAGSRVHRKLLVVDSVIALTGAANISRIQAGSAFSRNPERHPAAADPKLGHRELYVVLLLAVANARQRVWLTDGYFMPDERMLHALERAAQRGVDVRLVLPGHADSWLPFHAGRARYDRLLDAGVRIFERRDASFLPSQTASVEAIWIGAVDSIDRQGSFDSDRIVFDRAFARRQEQLFRLGEAASHEVRLADWRRRSLASRFKEWLARCCERLL